jgi:hypothetical protein
LSPDNGRQQRTAYKPQQHFFYKGGRIFWLAIHSNQANLMDGGLRHRRHQQTSQATAALTCLCVTTLVTPCISIINARVWHHPVETPVPVQQPRDGTMHPAQVSAHQRSIGAQQMQQVGASNATAGRACLRVVYVAQNPGYPAQTSGFKPF